MYYCNKCSVTRTFFENLVKALENGLSDVNSHAPANRTSSLKSPGKREREKPKTSRSSDSESVDEGGYWICEGCSNNNLQSSTYCVYCQDSEPEA